MLLTGRQEGIQPVKWMLVCWWCWSEWSFARLRILVVTTVTHCSNFRDNLDILVSAYPGCPAWRWPLEQVLLLLLFWCFITVHAYVLHTQPRSHDSCGFAYYEVFRRLERWREDWLAFLNEEPLVVKETVENPKVSSGWAKSMECDTFSLQCSDTVGRATGRASGL